LTISGDPVSTTGYILLGTTIGTALLHTLIPDHWLPFVLAGRARGWGAGFTALISGSSALIHTLGSLLLALCAGYLGREAATALGETLETTSGFLLILFGLIYAGWSWKKGGHFHPGGELFHGRDQHESHHGERCDGDPEHRYYQVDEGLIRGKNGTGAWTLAMIIGINPCILILPVILASVEQGPGTVGLVASAYAGTTCILMVGLSVLGVIGTRRIVPPMIARHIEMVSGLLIAATGVVVLLVHHH
jgi:ABC-type nickel/cobalt efflux system permease component RcnA